MKRHESLIPLTHDHHHALARARRMRLAAEGDDPDERLESGREFCEFYGKETILHFHEEEEVVFPLVVDRDDAPTELLTRVLLEHVRMHGLVAKLRGQVEAGAVGAELLGEVADLLRGHVRVEEDELFPAIQELVGDDELSGVHLAERDRTPPPRPS